MTVALDASHLYRVTAFYDIEITFARPEIPGALDKRQYLVIIRDNFCKFWEKNYVVTPHLNRLIEGSQNMVSLKNKKNYPELSSNTCFTWSEIIFF